MIDVTERAQRLAELQSKRVVALLGGPPLEASEERELEAMIDDAELAEAMRARAADERASEERERERARRARAYARILRVGIPLDDREAMARRVVRDELEPTRALHGARWWFSDDARARATLSLVLLGGTGVGKTVAAAWCIGRVEGSAYVKVRDLCRLYRSEYGPEREEWTRLLRFDLVVLDEIGTERDLDLARAAICELIDERHAIGARTLMLGNLDRKAFDGRYDERTHSRLEQRGLVVRLDDTVDRRRSRSATPSEAGS